ncbi:MAG: glycosyltransferase family 2 protein [Planctomycetota bacterium]|nr:glycosyltransferase family 2 protein [Planctomycetota bacterium]
MQVPRVSILIPTMNGEKDLARLLPALKAQRVVGGFEIVALDSESDDSTRERLQEFDVRYESIPRSEFQHGSARNRLGSMARGEFLVFLSQDALPVGTQFVETLTAPLQTMGITGTWARNLPHPTDDALTARSLLSSGESDPTSRRVKLGPGECLADLSPLDRMLRTRFNNVASAMSRESLERFPFPEVAFGEDSAWAARVLGAGLELMYVAEAEVLHAHRYGPRSAFKRYEQDARFMREVHGWVARPHFLSVLKGVAFELREDWRFLRQRDGAWSQALRAPFLRVGQVLGQWRGSRR